jgi:hypothetical protein
MKLIASPTPMPLPGMYDQDLAEAMSMLAGIIEATREAISYNIKNGKERFSSVLNQKDLNEAKRYIKIISKASEGDIKDVLASGGRYKLRGLSFLREQNNLSEEEKGKYMNREEIKRLGELLESLDKIQHKNLLAETKTPIAWLMDLSDALDKYGELEKANILDEAASLLVSAGKIDDKIPTADLILTVIQEFKAENPDKLKNELKKFLLSLPKQRIKDLDNIIADENSKIPVEDREKLMFAWQILNEPDNITQKWKQDPTSLKDTLDLGNPQYQKEFLSHKLNHRMFNLLYLAANRFDEMGMYKEAQKIDAALEILASLAKEFE